MCGRFVQAQPINVYADWFGVDAVKSESLKVSYNVAPTDQVYAVADHDGERLLGGFKWGLLPWFAKDRKQAARAINARVETAAEKPSFRDSFARRRCIIPADGFYEWERKEKGKLPHFIFAADRSPLPLAGLWSSWKDPETGERLRTCTILTGPPSDVVKPLHDRMPVTIPPELWDDWLDPENQDPEAVLAVLASAGPPDLAEYAVSTLVNKVQNNVPELIEPLTTGAVDQPTLDL
jgi:putative SOS response-associated peptidase YedK